MKIGYCPVCKDVFKLTWNVKECNCGKSSSVLKEQGTLSLTGPTRILEIHDSSLHEAINEHTYLKKEILVKLWPKNYFCINKIRSVPNTAVANKKNTRSPYLPKLVEESVKGPECRLCGSTMEFDGAETWVCPSCGEIMEVPY